MLILERLLFYVTFSTAFFFKPFKFQKTDAVLTRSKENHIVETGACKLNLKDLGIINSVQALRHYESNFVYFFKLKPFQEAALILRSKVNTIFSQFYMELFSVPIFPIYKIVL